MPVSPYVRTSSRARAVQIVHSFDRGSRDIEHIGSAHDEAELELLKAVARQRLAAEQGELDLGLTGGDQHAPGGPLPITASRMGHLWEALGRAFEVLGFAEATCGDEVFRDLVLARVIEPTSKLDSGRVLEEVGVSPVSWPRSSGGCRGMPSRPGGTSWRRRARPGRGWVRRRWCCMTSRRCTS